jgi:uncharacterized protein (TIGR02145 family)
MACYYENLGANLDKYGMMYNGYAVQTGKLAPAGWHVATEADWQTLTDYLISHGYNYDGSYSGNKIAKALASKEGWDPDDTPGSSGNDLSKNNLSGFNAMPGGFRSFDGQYFQSKTGCVWWGMSIPELSTVGLTITLSNLNTPNIKDKKYGSYVRCVKDAP